MSLTLVIFHTDGQFIPLTHDHYGFWSLLLRIIATSCGLYYATSIHLSFSFSVEQYGLDIHRLSQYHRYTGAFVRVRSIMRTVRPSHLRLRAACHHSHKSVCVNRAKWHSQTKHGQWPRTWELRNRQRSSNESTLRRPRGRHVMGLSRKSLWRWEKSSIGG